MLSVEKLKNFGADTEEGLSRCMGMADFYLQLCQMVLQEKSFDALKAAIEAKDYDKAFEAAHSLKGVLGNLSLTPLYTPASEITEHLRRKEDADYEGLLKELLEKKAEFDKLFED